MSPGAKGQSSAAEDGAAETLTQSVVSFAGLYVAFAALALVLYGPALGGTFVSDDQHYVFENCWIQDLNARNVAAILDPSSEVAPIVENYAPVHLLLHGLAWQVFGSDTSGHHVVNVLFHALAALLLALLFERVGIPRRAAWIGGALFLVNPANVEAVAWISQLKTSSALVLCLLALIAHPRRPLLGIGLFALALCAKPTAAVALPTVALFGWSEAARSTEPRRDWRWAWIAGWCVVFLLFAVAEFAAFLQTAGSAPPLYPEWGDRIRSTIAFTLRYLVTGLTTWGLSAFHEPPPAGWLDPWFLGALLVLPLLAWRLVVVWRRRSVEAAFWLWTVISYAPVSGAIPLPFPIADRYLYFMLPGLLGAILLAGPELFRWVHARMPALSLRRLEIVALVFALALGLSWSARTWQRADVWRSPHHFMADAERNYPEGAPARTRRARRAALAGDSDRMMEELRLARARGYNRLDHLLGDPAYAPYLTDERFRAFLVEIANDWLERLEAGSRPSQTKLRAVAQAHIFLGNQDAALAAMERAAAVQGCHDDRVAQELEELRRELRFRERLRQRS